MTPEGSHEGAVNGSHNAPTPHSAPSTEPTSCGSDSAGLDGKISLDTRSGTIPPSRCLTHPVYPATHHLSSGTSSATRPRPMQRGAPSRSRSLRALLSVAARGSILLSSLQTGRSALKYGCRDYNIPPQMKSSLSCRHCHKQVAGRLAIQQEKLIGTGRAMAASLISKIQCRPSFGPSVSDACPIGGGSLPPTSSFFALSFDQTEGNAIDALWYDYTSILIDQPIPVEVLKSLGRGYPNRWREIPNIPELMERLPWNQWDDQ